MSGKKRRVKRGQQQEDLRDDWRWPKAGLPHARLLGELKRRNALQSPYGGDRPAFCYPGTPIVRERLGFEKQRLFERQPNNIGTHTQHTREREGGFEGSQGVEAQAVWMVADLMGGDRETVDGYFCGGATEANMAGMWVGREWLRRHPDPMQRGIVVLCTPLTHYSIHKATALLDIGQASPWYTLCSRCHREHLFVPDPTGRGVTLVGMNERWEMDVGELERIFNLCYTEGFRRFLVVPTVGTTTMGSIDPVAEIGEFVRRKHRETHARFYVHVDAAFGGFTVPFVQPDRRIGFDVPEVMSIAVDGDKMGQLPYPAGIFLGRKDLQKLIARQVTYIRGHEDDTVSGSRSAIPALLAWYQFRADGREGQREYVRRCIEARDRLVVLVQRSLPWARIHRYSESVNILPIEFPIDAKHGDIPELLTRSWTERERAQMGVEERACAGLLAPYQLRADYVPGDPKDPESCPRIVYKLCIMPHTFAKSRERNGARVLETDDSIAATFVEQLQRAKDLWDRY